MRKLFLIPAVAAGLLAGCQPGSDTPTALESAGNIDVNKIRAHIEFLADDMLEGRDTGARGYQVAANYFATQCKLMGLEPAGDDGSYFQQVNFRKSALKEGHATLTVDGVEQSLAVPADYLSYASYNAAEETANGGIVFVGWGISAPEFDYDDYADVDVNGKIVMMIRRGAPDSFPSDERAYYSSSSYKMGEAVKRGARGVLIVMTPDFQEKFSWEKLQGWASRGGMEWTSPNGEVPNAHPELKLVGVLSYDLQAKLLEKAPKPLADMITDLKEGKPSSFALPAEISATRQSEWSEVSAPNVACMLPGSDPAMKDEYVLFSGHLDHIGMKSDAAEGEDHIYNGAYDNATGIGIMLEVARVFSSLPEKPKRSVLFLAVTGEEKGLLGSEYWAANPTVDISKVAANVNVDMPVLTFPVADVIAYGAEHSELGDIVREQAATQDFKLSPDPWPEEVIFVRSDQYSFVKAGVPAVFLVPGFTSADPEINGEEQMRGFEEAHYHGLSDDLSLPFDRDSARRFAAANFLVGMEVANRDKPVRWKDGDFFAEHFGKGREKVKLAP